MTEESVNTQPDNRIDWIRPLRYLWRGPWLVLHVLIGLPVTLILIATGHNRLTRSGGTWRQAAIHWWARTLCRIFGLRLEVHGEHAPDPVLAVANHISWLDIMVMDADWALSFVGKAEIEGWPVVGPVARAGGTVFHLRGCGDSRDRVVGAMTDRLCAGHSVAIFPEGRTGPGDRVLPFHGRLFAAAVDAGCAIQPVAIRFSRDGRRVDAFPFGPRENFVINFFRVLGEPPAVAELHYLAPIDSDGQGRREMARGAQAEIAAIVDP